MRHLLRLLPAVAVLIAPVFEGPASAGPCNTTDRLPFNGYVTACVDENGCLLYQDSGSEIHIQQPVCVQLAGFCRTVNAGRPTDAHATVCINSNGCLVYEQAGTNTLEQVPICVGRQ